MSQASHCPKCKGEMAQGFIMDVYQMGMVVSQWTEGAPQKTFFLGTKYPPEEKRIPVGTFRCVSCGFLESYARGEFAAE